MKLWPFSKKSDSVTDSLSLFRELGGWGSTKSGANVGHKNALEVSAVLACARVIAEGIAQVPFKLFKESGDSKYPAHEHHLYRVLYRKPNGWMTSFELRETMSFHVVLTGDAIAFVNRDVRGNVREIIPIEPGFVTVTRNEDYSLSYKVIAPNGNSQIFPQQAIWHWRGPSWNSYIGLDIVRLARESIGLSMAAEESQANMLKNGGAMTGLYSVEGTLKDDQYKALRKFLDTNFGGVKNASRIKLLDRNAKFTPISMTGVEAQLVENRKFQIEEICRVMRVMPIMIGFSDKSSTYASAEQMFLAHVVHTLSPWYQRIEQSAECQLLTDDDLSAGYFVKFIPAGLMRGSHKDRAQFYSKALGSGNSPAWMTQDEVRSLEDLNPLGGEASELPKRVNTPNSEKDTDLDNREKDDDE